MVSIVFYSPSLIIIASRTQFHVFLPSGQRLHSIVHSTSIEQICHSCVLTSMFLVSTQLGVLCSCPASGVRICSDGSHAARWPGPGVLTPPAALQHCSTAEEECPCLQCLQRDHSPHPRRVLISLLVTRRLWWRWCSQGGDNVPVWHSSGGQVAGGSQAKCNLVWSFLSHGPRAGAGMHRALRHRHTSHQHCHVSRVMSWHTRACGVRWTLRQSFLESLY